MKPPFTGDQFFRPNKSKNDYERGQFILEIIDDPKEILKLEVKRVRWYLDHYGHYKKLGYKIRFPEGIDPERAPTLSDNDITTAIEKEANLNAKDYKDFAKELQEVWREMSDKILRTADEIYGFRISGHFKIAPTAYGTGGGPLEEGGPVFYRLPKYRPLSKITEEEAVVHEILAHSATEHLRKGTAIDESIHTTHQWHKERLMDLLGRTLLVRSGIMKREDVVMDTYAEEQAAKDIDALYYTNPENPDENELRYEGDLAGLIKAIEDELQ